MADLAVENGGNALAAEVGLVLGDGQAEVDIQTASRRAGVVLLLRGFPVAAVGLQNFHHLVVVGDRAEPAVETGEQDQVDLVVLHVLQHPQEVRSLRHALAGGFGRVDVNARDDPALRAGVPFEVLLLRLQG